ncbi:uncharacterized protein LOC132706405 [Cylas formicarius]|uniref:uncharacterized protein LOC132706405 n=1 Tax=Cylas formicarius TaxID=197179 RepID=UPI0029588AB1|nr:uncharacterized protein LOC132706405 [Cylas formicarius]
MRPFYICRCLISASILFDVFVESAGNFRKCKINSQDADACLSVAIEDAVKEIKSGVPEFGIPQIDPLKVDSLSVDAGVGAVHFAQHYKNLVVTGFGEFKVNQSHLDLDNGNLTFWTIHPKIEQRSDYDIDGKILMLPMKGNGPCTLTLTNVLITNEILFDTEPKDSEVFLHVQRYTMRVHPTRANFNFENLFGGNKMLGDNINDLLNREWEVILADIKGGYELYYSTLFQDWAGKIFDRTPIDQLFLQRYTYIVLRDRAEFWSEMVFFSVSLVVALMVNVVRSAPLPNGFSSCKLSDPNVDECLAKSIENGVRLVKSGLPDLNIKPLEPYDFGSLVVGAGTGAVLFEQHYQDLKVIGATSLTVTKAHFNPKKKVLTFTSVHPRLIQEGKYNVNGKLLIFQVYGKGPSKVQLDNLQIRHRIELEEVARDGDTYYDVKSYRLELLPEKVHYHFDDLVEGNQALSKSINGVLNDEWKTVFDDIKSGFEAGYANVLKEYSKSFFDKVPAKEIFLS